MDLNPSKSSSFTTYSLLPSVPRERSSTPSNELLHLPSCHTNEDLVYCIFLTNLIKPFKGKARGMTNPPPQIISSNLTFKQDQSNAFNIVRDIEEIADKTKNSSSEGSLMNELNSIKSALRKLFKRCQRISQKAKGFVRGWRDLSCSDSNTENFELKNANITRRHLIKEISDTRKKFEQSDDGLSNEYEADEWDD